MNLSFEMFRKVRVIILIQLVFVGIIYAQNNKEELEKRKAENQEQIQYIRNTVDKMTKTKEASVNQINLIQRSLELRQNLIENISDEINLLSNDIEYNTEEISRINKRIELIKSDYAKLIKNSYNVLDKEYSLMYILSSQDINQFYLRIKYLKYLTNYRRNLIAGLDSEKLNYIVINKNLGESKRKNIKLLEERKREMNNLDREKKEQIALVKKLQNQEKELKRKLQEREKMMLQIEAELKRLIEEEARKAREARKKTNLTESERILSSEFYRNKGKLPWPLEKGIITGKFGKQNHAVLKDVKFNNLGIDITTVKGSKIRSVFEGQVSTITPIMGANYTIIIKHGDFYTGYQNIVDLKVKTGDFVKAKEEIGTAFTDMENITKIHFIICKDKFLDPELWLSK
jgi:septal ring factor EnvC (AmiA/AmiB activator)